MLESKSLKHRRLRYGLSENDISALFIFQNGRCGVCNRRLLGGRFVIEHNHKSGLVRGLCCQWCNGHVLAVLESPLTGGERYLADPPAYRLWPDRGPIPGFKKKSYRKISPAVALPKTEARFKRAEPLDLEALPE